VCTARAFLDTCIELHTQGRLNQEMASMAKLKGTELEFSVADICLQMHGGYGYMWCVMEWWIEERVVRKGLYGMVALRDCADDGVAFGAQFSGAPCHVPCPHSPLSGNTRSPAPLSTLACSASVRQNVSSLTP
jgi:hypothetical protein